MIYVRRGKEGAGQQKEIGGARRRESEGGFGGGSILYLRVGGEMRSHVGMTAFGGSSGGSW